MLAKSINNRLFINQCIFCLQSCSNKLAVCNGCLSDLPMLQSCCSICAISLTTANKNLVCGNCQKKRPSFNQVQAAFHYQFPIDHFISLIKYKNKPQYISSLVKLATDNLSYPTGADMLIPIPMYRLNLIQRGFNQAELIARHLSSFFNIPLNTTLLKKIRPTKKQMTLKRTERLKNKQLAFQCTELNDSHVVLVDDVITTGATLEAATRVMLQAGASRVDAIVIARA